MMNFDISVATNSFIFVDQDDKMSETWAQTSENYYQQIQSN